MAKSNGQLENMEEVNSPGFFQKFFFWFLIPLMFVIAILLVIASFTNINVFEKTKELTGSLPFVASNEEVPTETIIDEQKIVELQAEIEEKEAEIEQLHSQLESAQAQNQEAAIKQEQLEYEIQKLQREQGVAEQEFTEIVAAYEQMSAKEAAPIIVELSDDEALHILSSLDSEKLSEILSKMSPADAAKYTEMLSQ